jgi:hypothetical protein
MFSGRISGAERRKPGFSLQFLTPPAAGLRYFRFTARCSGQSPHAFFRWRCRYWAPGVCYLFQQTALEGLPYVRLLRVSSNLLRKLPGSLFSRYDSGKQAADGSMRLSCGSPFVK